MGMSTWLLQPCGMLPKGPISLLPFQSTESWAVRLGGSEKLGEQKPVLWMKHLYQRDMDPISHITATIESLPKATQDISPANLPTSSSWSTGNPKTLLGSPLHIPQPVISPLCTLLMEIRLSFFQTANIAHADMRPGSGGQREKSRTWALTSTLGEPKGKQSVLRLGFAGSRKGKQV